MAIQIGFFIGFVMLGKGKENFILWIWGKILCFIGKVWKYRYFQWKVVKDNKGKEWNGKKVVLV